MKVRENIKNEIINKTEIMTEELKKGNDILIKNSGNGLKIQILKVKNARNE